MEGQLVGKLAVLHIKNSVFKAAKKRTAEFFGQFEFLTCYT